MPTSSELVEVTFPTGDLIRVLPHREAAHHFATWEACVLPSLRSACGAGAVLFDVGAEIGEFAVMCAKAGAAVHLLEPVWRNWPGMRATFEANGVLPAGCWQGFVADASHDGEQHQGRQGWPRDGELWPDATDGQILLEQHFGVLHEHPHVPAITLDEYAAKTGARPTVITMDCEGAEGVVLAGGLALIRSCRPTVFVSIHPWQHYMDRYKWTQERIFRLFYHANYRGRFLGEDHECHWRFDPL